MSEVADCDLLVVGAGPAGSALAARAAAAGWDVILAEAGRHPRPKACAEYASPRIVEELRGLGLEAVDWRPATVPLAGMTIVRDAVRFELRYADRRGARAAWGVDRARLDALLAARAADAGARLLEGSRMTGLRWRGRRVTGARLEGPSGRHEVAARLVVGADGARSATARLLGVERTVRWPRRLGLIAHYEGAGLAGSGEMHVARDRYVGLAPRPGGQLNVGMALPLDGDRRPSRVRFEETIAALPAVADRLAGARRLTRIRGMAPIGQRVSEVAGPGWLLVGDAAGFIDPFTGEGIYRALRGARAAAAAAEEALRGDERAAAAGYRAERRRAFGGKDLLTWLVQGFLALPPLFDYAAARLAERPAARLRLASALGDCRPASEALAPLSLVEMLRP